MNKQKLKDALSKVRSFQVAFRAVDGSDDGKVIVEGLASTPDIDSYESIIEPSAYADSMRDYLAKNPVVLLQHKADKPIGQVVEYSIDQGGLFVRAEVTQDVDGVFSAIKNRVLRGFSVGFMPVSYEFRMVGEREILVLTKIDMKEISVVSIPANPNTLFSVARSMQEFGDDLRAVRSEDTQDAAAPADVVPEISPTVSEPVQPSENPGETPEPAQAVEAEQAKEEDVKPVEPSAEDAAAAQAQAEAEAKAQEEAEAKAKADAEAAAQAQAEAEKAQLSQELTEAKTELESERASRKAAEDKLAALETSLAAERSARAESERQLTIAKLSLIHI